MTNLFEMSEIMLTFTFVRSKRRAENAQNYTGFCFLGPIQYNGGLIFVPEREALRKDLTNGNGHRSFWPLSKICAR